jgi:hypothetical protein
MEYISVSEYSSRTIVDRKILITVDPLEAPHSPVSSKLEKLFSDALNIKIAKEIQIDAQMEEMNDALS